MLMVDLKARSPIESLEINWSTSIHSVVHIGGHTLWTFITCERFQGKQILAACCRADLGAQRDTTTATVFPVVSLLCAMEPISGVLRLLDDGNKSTRRGCRGA